MIILDTHTQYLEIVSESLRLRSESLRWRNNRMRAWHSRIDYRRQSPIVLVLALVYCD